DRGACMQNLGGISQVTRRNDITFAWRSRIICRGQNHSPCIGVFPFEGRKFIQSPRCNSVEDPCERSLQQRKQRLSFWISEAAVELNDGRSFLPPRQARV